MSNSIIIRFKPKGDKELIASLRVLTRLQKQLQGELKKTTKSSNVLGRAFSRNQKNATMLGNAFSTMRSKMLLLSFAMSLGGRQLVEFSKKSALLDNMSRAFTNLQGGTENASIAIENLRFATNNTMSSFDLFQQANNAMILGVSKNSEELAEMFDTAQRLGRALGVDTARSVESLITGIGRQSRLMLDNIGIIVKSEEAYEEYAKELDTTVDKLTDADKKQAFFNAAMKAGKDALKDLGDEQLTTSDRFAASQATFENFTNFIGEKATPIVLGFLEGTASFMRRIMESNLDTALRQMRELGGSLQQIAQLQRAVALEDANEKLTKNLKKIKTNIQGTFSLLADEQKLALGATFKEVDAEVAKVLGHITTSFGKVKIFNVDETEVDQQKVSMLMKHIEVQMKSLDAVNSEADMEKLNNLSLQLSSLAEILAALGEIEKAEAIIAGKPPIITEDENEDANDFKETIKGIDAVSTATISKIKSLTDGVANFLLTTSKGQMTWKNFGELMTSQLQRIIADIISTKLALLALNSLKIEIPIEFKSGSAASSNILGLIPGFNLISDLFSNILHNGGQVQGYNTGGMVPLQGYATGGGVDNVPAMLQEGEYVMRRSAVESIGIENLNRMNRTGQVSGGVNINFTGNVLSRDFIEDEAVPLIKNALRKGGDLGLA